MRTPPCCGGSWPITSRLCDAKWRGRNSMICVTSWCSGRSWSSGSWSNSDGRLPDCAERWARLRLVDDRLHVRGEDDAAEELGLEGRHDLAEDQGRDRLA